MSITYDFVAVIVTFNPDRDLFRHVSELADLCKKVVIIDNGSASRTICLSDIESNPKVKVVYNGYNLGIATALNIGILKARELNPKWILTLDQDTYIDRSSIGLLVNAYESHPNPDSIGILAPVHYDRTTGYQSRLVKGLRDAYTSRKIVMSSGNLVPVHTYDKVGLYDDDMFIEYVDHDFCLRTRSKGLKIIIVKEAQMAHSLGSIRQHGIGPFFFFSHNYQPVRRYYRARNRLILYRRHPGLWILQDQIFAIKDMLKILLVEKSKWSKVMATFEGTFDGLLSRMGDYHGAQYLTPKAQKYFVEFREEIVTLLPNGEILRVLDLGCGSGETSGYLRSTGKFRHVVGVEGSEIAAKTAAQKLDQVVVGDIEKVDLPFAEGSFDLILTLDILEHLVDPWTAVERLYKLLKPGGRLIVSIPNVRHYSVVLPLLLAGDWRYSQEGLLDSTHIRFFTKKTMLSLFKNVGLELEKMDHTGAKRGIGAALTLTTGNLLKGYFVFQYLFLFRKPLTEEKK